MLYRSFIVNPQKKGKKSTDVKSILSYPACKESMAMLHADLMKRYNAFNVYRRELAPGTVSLTGDRAQGDDSDNVSCYRF